MAPPSALRPRFKSISVVGLLVMAGLSAFASSPAAAADPEHYWVGRIDFVDGVTTITPTDMPIIVCSTTGNVFDLDYDIDDSSLMGLGVRGLAKTLTVTEAGTNNVLTMGTLTTTWVHTPFSKSSSGSAPVSAIAPAISTPGLYRVQILAEYWDGGLTGPPSDSQETEFDILVACNLDGGSLEEQLEQCTYPDFHHDLLVPYVEACLGVDIWDPDAYFLTATIENTQCDGTYGFLGANDAGTRAMLSPTYDPVLEDANENVFWAIVVAIIVGVVTVGVMIWQEFHDENGNPVDPSQDYGPLEYTWECRADLEFVANGNYGVLRRVAIEAPDAATGEYQEIGAPCSYDGIARTNCAAPAIATFKNQLIERRTVVDEFPYESAPPSTVTACTSPAVRAVNSFQYNQEPIPPIQTAVIGFSDSLCEEDIDVDWNGATVPNAI